MRLERSTNPVVPNTFMSKDRDPDIPDARPFGERIMDMEGKGLSFHAVAGRHRTCRQLAVPP
ncbi:hypothetical protein GCM10019071_34960 [Sphingobium fuliginis]|uniref:Uncharacterized protein n=1 Tax=Sphingobium fuliginis (strain ATCC 27551) TaxID=336203 RepID=A0ABQ1F785_SPHSA|nr:hypothetical protein GCM10019071_34960 [Sphingobium fuliginis]